MPGFNGDEVKLYLEVLLPLAYVEQKYGWAGLAPRVPTHYRIRSAYRRAAEFILGLNSLERLKQIDQLRAAISQAQEGWATESRALESFVATRGWRIVDDVNALLANPDNAERVLNIEMREDGEWVAAATGLDHLRDRLRQLEESPVQEAGSRTETAREELRAAESELFAESARLRRGQEDLDAVQAERLSLASRRDELEAERERLKDVRTLERLGSELGVESVSTAHCPVCAQSLDAAHVATGLVLDVVGHLALLDSEKVTLSNLISDAEARVATESARVDNVSSALFERRRRVRALKDELAGASSAPSVSQVEERLALRSRVQESESAIGQASSAFEALSARAQTLTRLRERLNGLLRQDADDADSRAVGAFQRAFRSALRSFGLRSLPVDEVAIGEADSPPRARWLRAHLSTSDTGCPRRTRYGRNGHTTLGSPTRPRSLSSLTGGAS